MDVDTPGDACDQAGRRSYPCRARLNVPSSDPQHDTM
jgi:hypothetical protein